MHDLTKGAWEGVIFGSFAKPPYDYSDPRIVRYKDALAKYYPDVRWGVFPFAGFIYAEPFTAALRNMGSDVTREGLIAALDQLKDVDLVGAKVSFSPDNHQALRTMQLLKCTGPEEYELLSDFISSDSDIEHLASELESF